MGEVLDGDRMALSMYDISFKSPFERKALCTDELGEQDIMRLRHAIEDLYYFEFVYGESHSSDISLCVISAVITDDLPIRGFIGHLEEGSILPHNHKTYLWTHLHFSFEYNGDQVWWEVHGQPACVVEGYAEFLGDYSQRQYTGHQPSAS